MELFNVITRLAFGATMTFELVACATMLTVVSAWAFVTSTASGERDPFQFASIMAANAKARVTRTAGSQNDDLPGQVLIYSAPDLLAVPPPCLGSCA